MLKEQCHGHDFYVVLQMGRPARATARAWVHLQPLCYPVIIHKLAVIHRFFCSRTWSVRKGLYNAPRVHVVVSDQIHSAIKRALWMIGMGEENVKKLPTDRRLSQR